MMLQGIASRATVITPDDDDLIGQTIGVFVGGAGNLNATLACGVDCLFTGVVAGSILPISVVKIKSTSTTATNIVALYYQ